MPFIKKAGAANLTGHQCEVCDSEVGADQPIFYDVDGDADGKATATVWCAWCYSAVQDARCKAYVEAAEAVARCATVGEAAAVLVGYAKRLAAAMAQAKAA